MKEKIITARMKEDSLFQISYLKQHLKIRNTTQVIAQAISYFFGYVEKNENKKTPFDHLEDLNLLGCFEGEKDLSSNYKSVISKSLQAKGKINEKP